MAQGLVNAPRRLQHHQGLLDGSWKCSAPVCSEICWPGEGGGRWGGQRRGVKKEHSLYNSILIVSMCTFIVYMYMRTAIEASGVTSLPLVKAQMGKDRGVDKHSTCLFVGNFFFAAV